MSSTRAGVLLSTAIALPLLLAPTRAFPASVEPDRQLTQAIYTNHSELLDEVMPVLTDMGNRRSVILFSAALLFVDGERGWTAGQLSLESLALSAGVVQLIKSATNRQRPTGDTTRKNSSFPSGHAAAAFSVATVVSGTWPTLRVPAYLVATGIAYSRVYLGRHFVTDVAVGALIGYGVSRILLHNKEKVTFGSPPFTIRFSTRGIGVTVPF